MSCLSNDPGKKGSNFFCYDAIRFHHMGMFSYGQEKSTIYLDHYLDNVKTA